MARTAIVAIFFSAVVPRQAGAAGPPDDPCVLKPPYEDWHSWAIEELEAKHTAGQLDERIRSAYATAMDELAPPRRRSAAARRLRRWAQQGSALAMSKHAIVQASRVGEMSFPHDAAVWSYLAAKADPVAGLAADVMIGGFFPHVLERDPVEIGRLSRRLCAVGVAEGCLVSAHLGLEGSAEPLPPRCIIAQAEAAAEGLPSIAGARFILARALLTLTDGDFDEGRVLSLMQDVIKIKPDRADTFRQHVAARSSDKERVPEAARVLWDRALAGDADALQFWFQTTAPFDPARRVCPPSGAKPRELVELAVAAAKQQDRRATKFLVRCLAGDLWCSDHISVRDFDGVECLDTDYDPVFRAEAMLIRALSAWGAPVRSEATGEELARWHWMSASAGLPSAMRVLSLAQLSSPAEDPPIEALAWYRLSAERIARHHSPTLRVYHDASSKNYMDIQVPIQAAEAALQLADPAAVELRVNKLRELSSDNWREMSSWLDLYRRAYGP